MQQMSTQAYVLLSKRMAAVLWNQSQWATV